jgi:hypothetical protein
VYVIPLHLALLRPISFLLSERENLPFQWKKLEYVWEQSFQDNVCNYETERDRRLDEVTVESHLPRFIGTASHQDMQTIIEFFLENRLLWQFEVGKNFY